MVRNERRGSGAAGDAVLDGVGLAGEVGLDGEVVVGLDGGVDGGVDAEVRVVSRSGAQPSPTPATRVAVTTTRKELRNPRAPAMTSTIIGARAHWP